MNNRQNPFVVGLWILVGCLVLTMGANSIVNFVYGDVYNGVEYGVDVVAVCVLVVGGWRHIQSLTWQRDALASRAKRDERIRSAKTAQEMIEAIIDDAIKDE